MASISFMLTVLVMSIGVPLNLNYYPYFGNGTIFQISHFISINFFLSILCAHAAFTVSEKEDIFDLDMLPNPNVYLSIVIIQHIFLISDNLSQTSHWHN